MHEFFPVAPSIGCGGGPAFAATGVGFSFDVAITNLSAIDYQDLFMVVDPDTDFLFGNWDGLIQGLHAMRIDRNATSPLWSHEKNGSNAFSRSGSS